MRWNFITTKIMLLFLIISMISADILYMNGSGGTFPQYVYQDVTFAYRYVEIDQVVNYLSLGSTTGKCNIMGYWHTGNTEAGAPSSTVKSIDTLICTDACTIATCGFSSATNPRPDRLSRHPLVDFGASDATLKTADYTYFPDLQMFPSVGGAAVPIYNIPELTVNSSLKLVFSRATITNIFLGNILYWNDSRILADNSGETKTILSELAQPITAVMRTDSSGTSNIFSAALSSFDPARPSSYFDASFATQVTSSTTPNWCGLLTDELQYISIAGCNPSLAPSSAKEVILAIVASDYKVRHMNFSCDTDAYTFATLFQAANDNKKVHVTKSVSGYTSKFTVGYLASTDTSAKKPRNWYQPYVYSEASELTVTITTKQEGGYLNSHYNYPSKPVLQEIKSIWIDTSANFTFVISYGQNTSTTILNSLSLTSTKLLSVLDVIAANVISSVKENTYTSTTWVEYQITFKVQSTSWTASKLTVNVISDVIYDLSIAVTTLTTANNFPIFYDTVNTFGFSYSGKYTCYKRDQNYTAWTYHTGNVNPGVIAEVSSTLYSIGYSVLGDALQYNLPIADMINLAGNIITPTANSVAYAVLEKGGNLDSHFAANLVDGSSSNVWPITGYTYLIVRTKTHIGDCSRRQAAMEYLYNFYHSDTVQQIATANGFAILPSFIRDIIITKMVNTVLCKDGSYALPEYRANSLNFLTSSIIYYAMSIYLNVYKNVDSTASFELTSFENSQSLWTTFLSQPESYGGAFTVFSSAAIKRQQYLKGYGKVITSAFAHFAIVPVYHLDYYTSKAGVRLQFTAEILGDIFSGTILYWNDTKIQTANSAYSQYLPHKRIRIVVQSNNSDTNALWSRFLTLNSPTFASTYGLSSNGSRSIDFASVLDPNYLVQRDGVIFIDDGVTHFDGSIGMFNSLYGVPNSYVGKYCHDAECEYIVDPSDGGVSVGNCQLDAKTIVSPKSTITTYDLMLSNSTSCYPIVGTVEYSTFSEWNSDSCVLNSSVKSTISSVAQQRVKFSAWLYNGSVVTGPLGFYQATSSPTTARNLTYTDICNIECYDRALGYQYCSYRDCTWADGDFIQSVTQCDSKTSSRDVVYTLKSGRNCLRNSPSLEPPSSVTIECSYVTSGSALGITAYVFCALGVILCVVVLGITINHRYMKIIKKSQPIFIYTFIIGAICINLCIIVYVGPNTNATCLMRPWLFNFSATIMFAPLVMKLHRVDLLFNNPKLKKMKITDFQVISQVLMILSMDCILLILWTFLETPRAIRVKTTKYANVLQPVYDRVCSTGLSNYFEIIFIVYKSLILAFGVYKAISTWNVPSDLSEAKHFAVAIYNITMIGGLAYFLSLFLLSSTGIGAAVILRCLGLFICATIAVVVVMTPKLLVVEGVTVVPVGAFSSTESSASVAASVKTSRQSRAMALNRINQANNAPIIGPAIVSRSSKSSMSHVSRVEDNKNDILESSVNAASRKKPEADNNLIIEEEDEVR